MNTVTSKSTKKNKFILAIVVTFALACGLFPCLASAAPLEAGQVDDQALSTQATKTVYVITSVKEVADWGITSTTTSKYSYNKSGQVAKVAASNNMDGDSTTTYAYKSGVLKSTKQVNPGTKVSTTHTTNAKGLFTKAVQVNEQSADIVFTRTFNGTYKSGKLKKIVCTTNLGAGDETNATKETYTFTYKNGRVASRTVYGTTAEYTYDAKGNLNNIGGSQYKNTYNAKNQLTKTTLSEEGYTYKKTYTYKAITVNASDADKVEAQQWAIINNNLNFAFGLDEL